MAIHTKKRDRVTMAVKRDRLSMEAGKAGSASAALALVPADQQEEEYERAVAFLREFHSRRAANHLHSTSLDAILESDGFDEVLASDFALALTVGPSRSRDPEPSANNEPPKSEGASFLKVVADVPPPGGYSANINVRSEPSLRRVKRSSSGSLSRMKRASTSKCLLDLDSSSGSDDDDKSPTSSSTNLFTSCALRTPSNYLPNAEPDFYFGYDYEESHISLPVTKRHRGHGQPRLATGVLGR